MPNKPSLAETHLEQLKEAEQNDWFFLKKKLAYKDEIKLHHL